MKKSDSTEQVITRRKALGRIGLFATAAYTVPAFATLSMAHANSGASNASNGTSAASDGTSTASEASVASVASVASGPSISIPSDVEALCSENDITADLGNAEYVQCLINNGELLTSETLKQVLALTI
jgi:hypothetical protein